MPAGPAVVTAIALTLGVASLPSAGAAADWAGALRIDGVATEIAERTVAGDAGDIAASIAASWRAERPDEPVVATRAGDGRLLGQRVGRRWRTARVEAVGGGTRVLQSSRDLHARPVPAALPLRLPPTARLLRTVESVDPGAHALQAVAGLPGAVDAASRAIDDAARRAGWVRTTPAGSTAPPGAPSASAAATQATAWRRGGDELIAVLAPGVTGTTVLLHVVTSAREERAP